MLLIFTWESGFNIQDFFMLSQWPWYTNCCNCIQFNGAWNAHFPQCCCFNGLFSLLVSLSPSFYFPSSASHFLPLLFLSLSLCVCGVFPSLPGRWWLQSDISRLHSQAKHQNTQHWWVTTLLSLSCCKWTAANFQMLVNIWLWLQSLICVPIIVKWNQPFVRFLFYCWQKKIHWP